MIMNLILILNDIIREYEVKFMTYMEKEKRKSSVKTFVLSFFIIIFLLVFSIVVFWGPTLVRRYFVVKALYEMNEKTQENIDNMMKDVHEYYKIDPETGKSQADYDYDYDFDNIK